MPRFTAIVMLVTSAARPYHHGDLRRALLAVAIALIAEPGPGAVGLRELARRIGVSHAAPAHHFGDKKGLFTALATEGYGLFAAALRAAYEETGSFEEVGVAYVRFSVEHRPYFEVMFRPELYRRDDPELVNAKRAAGQMLYSPVGRRSADDPGFDRLRAGIAAWSFAHGLAELYASDNLPRQLGDDPESIARSIASYIFRPLPEPRKR